MTHPKFAVFVLAVVVGACGGANRDRFEPEFAPRQTVTSINGPVTFAVAPSGRVVYAELRTNDVFVAETPPKLLFSAGNAPDSLVVDGEAVIVATRTAKHRVQISRDERVIWNGPTSRYAAHLALTERRELVVGLAGHILRLDPDGHPDQKPAVISSRWQDPVVTPGRGDRLWVADNGPPGQKERVARGRENDVAKRNRFASTLPDYTNPTGMARLDDQLLLCSRTHKRVYRLHIGLDDVARRRDWMKGLVCDRDIAVDRAGALYTATNGAIYRYPPR